MKTIESLQELSLQEAIMFEGGLGKVAEFLCFILGAGFSNPGKMAIHGESPMDIAAFK